MASLVAVVAVMSLTIGYGAPKPASKEGIRSNAIVLSVDPQPEGKKLDGGVRSSTVDEGVISSIVLVSPSNVTVNVRGYETGVLLQENATDFFLEVPEGTSDKFASGTHNSEALFTGVLTNVSLTANTPKTIYFKIQNISVRTQFTIFAFSSGSDAGGAHTFVAIPE